MLWLSIFAFLVKTSGKCNIIHGAPNETKNQPIKEHYLVAIEAFGKICASRRYLWEGHFIGRCSRSGCGLAHKDDYIFVQLSIYRDDLSGRKTPYIQRSWCLSTSNAATVVDSMTEAKQIPIGKISEGKRPNFSKWKSVEGGR